LRDHQLLDSVDAVSGLLVFCVALIVMELKKKSNWPIIYRLGRGAADCLALAVKGSCIIISTLTNIGMRML